MYGKFFKLVIDLIASFFFLLVLSPLLVIIIVLLTLANRGRIFFLQQRTGKNGEIFWVIKFKTMNDKVDKNGKLLSDKERLTLVGKFIRTTSLDELPQMINVLKGDMSLIGPRPLLPKYLPLYNQNQQRRHDVKPGITGWAQVNGRNAISWSKKFEYDVWYVDNLSFLLDLKIICLTIIKIFKREGINAQGSATISAFNGNN